MAGRKRPGEFANVVVRMPAGIKKMAQECAASTGMSLSQFVTQAVSQRVRNWEDPLTGKKITVQYKEQTDTAPYVGWVCGHAGHGGEVSAAECVAMKAPKHHRASWYRPDDLRAAWSEG